jgi:hypothetical protein
VFQSTGGEQVSTDSLPPSSGCETINHHTEDTVHVVNVRCVEGIVVFIQIFVFNVVSSYRFQGLCVNGTPVTTTFERKRTARFY